MLEEKPGLGTHLGHNIYKIRIGISSKGKGKSGEARVITFFVTEDQEFYLVHIYDKNQFENLTKEQIFELLRKAGFSIASFNFIFPTGFPIIISALNKNQPMFCGF